MADYIAVVQPAVDNLPNAEGILVGDVTEGGHTISSELVEKIRGNKTDYSYGSVNEEITFTCNNVSGDKGQDQFKQAIKKLQQIKVWLIEKKKSAQGHKTIFGYTVVEEYAQSFDDEEDTIEVTLKVKFNTAEDYLTDVPEEWLNPSELAREVEFEKIGENTGTLETKQRADIEG
ncbi:phage tail protein [Mammaliicoccus sciuri]|uniref:phage tail protein n=1 Tax=Mammaliicoccus sciuri TaxID=1296 RepID=UPI001625035E|nr:phage tail protein [Mammaliicoccus sciuri]